MSGYAPGSVRVWDGTTWRYKADEWQTPTFESILEGGASGLITTTTSCTRSTSTVHSGSSLTLTASTTGRNGGSIEFYKRVGSGSWSRIASTAAPSGGGNVTVSDTPTADGTTYYAAFTGSSTHKASQSAATGDTTVQTKKTATKSVPVGWVQAYNGSGNRISGSGNDNAVHQGYYSGTHGNRKSLLRFDPNLPAGADVSSVVLECNGGWAHWYNNAGGTIVVGSFNSQNSEPATWGAASTHPNRSRKSVDTGSWEVNITAWADTAVTASSFSGITIGPGPTTSLEFYGYSVASPAGNFALRISYSYWS
jgi:hypothetical protein